MRERFSPDAAESVLSSEVSNRQLRKSLVGELKRVLHPYHPQATLLLFEDPARLEVVVVLGFHPTRVPALPTSRAAELETASASAPPGWWLDVVQLWKLLGSPSRVQLSP